MMTFINTEVQPTRMRAGEWVELQPIFKEIQAIPAIRPTRSDIDKKCAATMLEKLRRGEDRAVDLSAAYDSDRVMDVVAERVLIVLNV